MNTQIDIGNAYYEQRATVENMGSDIPSPGSPTLLTPLIATAVDEFASRISGSVLTPRPVLIRGNNAEATQQQYNIAQFINNKYTDLYWDEAADTAIHLAGRDGTGIIEITWEQRTRTQVKSVMALQPDGTEKRERVKIQTTVYDDVKWTPRELKDFMYIPNDAHSVEDADGVAVKVYLNENEVRAMVRSGIFKAEAAEKMILSLNPGQSEKYTDPDGISTETINNQLNIGDVTVSTSPGIHMRTSTFRLWKIHTDLYDMDGDGIAEENVFWFHDQLQDLIGWAPYEYEGGRPFFVYAPWPYPNRGYGASIPLRLRPYQDEDDKQRLCRLDALDRINMAMYMVEDSVNIRESDRKLGPLHIFRIPDGSGEPIKPLAPPPYPDASLKESQMIRQDADRVVGAPQVGGMPAPGSNGGGTSGRVSARAAQYQAAAQGQQTNKVLQRTRRWLHKMMKFSLGLYRQYSPSQIEVVTQSENGGDRVKLPREILGLDYQLTIVGSGGPMDKEKNMENAERLYQLVTSNPVVQGDLELVYNATIPLLEAHDVADTTMYLGTRDAVKQKQQQQAIAQQQAQQMEMQKQLASHTKFEPNRAPAGNPHAGS